MWLNAMIFYKIGKSSNNPKSRLDNLQVGNPYKLELVVNVWVKEVSFFEKCLHFGLESKNHKNEWFKLDKKVIKVFIILFI